MKLARFAQNSHEALEKGVLHLAKTGFVSVVFIKNRESECNMF